MGCIRSEEDNTESLLNAIQPSSLQANIRQQAIVAKMGNTAWTFANTLKMAIELEKMSPENWDADSRIAIPKPTMEEVLKKKTIKLKAARHAAEEFLVNQTEQISQATSEKFVPPVKLPCRYCSDFGHNHYGCPDKHANKAPINPGWHSEEARIAYKAEKARKRGNSKEKASIRRMKKEIKSLKKKQKGYAYTSESD